MERRCVLLFDDWGKIYHRCQTCSGAFASPGHKCLNPRRCLRADLLDLVYSTCSTWLRQRGVRNHAQLQQLLRNFKVSAVVQDSCEVVAAAVQELQVSLGPAVLQYNSTGGQIDLPTAVSCVFGVQSDISVAKAAYDLFRAGECNGVTCPFFLLPCMAAAHSTGLIYCFSTLTYCAPFPYNVCK